MMMTEGPGRSASGESPFRANNVLTYEALLRFTADGPQHPRSRHALMCECTLPDCEESVHLTLDEIRRTIVEGTCRVIAPEHLLPGELPGGIERQEQFWVVPRPEA